MPTDHSLHHIGITVADLDAAEAFWEELLRTKSVRRYTIEGLFIAEMTGYPDARILASQVNLPTGGYLELLQYVHPTGKPINPETTHPGNVHICLVVDDAEAEWQRAIALGATPRSTGPVTVPSGANAGARTGYLRTTDGVTLELFQPPRHPTASPTPAAEGAR